MGGSRRVVATGTGRPPAENAELDLHRAALHLRLEAAHEAFADKGASRRKQSQKANDVGQDAGSDEQGPGNENNDPVHGFLAGQISSGQPLIESSPGVDAFATSEIASGQSRCDNEPNRWPEADKLVDLDEQTELDRRGKQKK